MIPKNMLFIFCIILMNSNFASAGGKGRCKKAPERAAKHFDESFRQLNVELQPLVEETNKELNKNLEDRFHAKLAERFTTKCRRSTLH